VREAAEILQLGAVASERLVKVVGWERHNWCCCDL
jgi:hypothetical protein